MKTVVVIGGTDGIGCGLARTCLGREDRAVVVGTDEAKAEPGARRLYDYTREVLAP
jgi:NAD(P)-dependent dehydrogenase (short-subunit alcohol dehydrogenase family)